jgi:hypothetical protein
LKTLAHQGGKLVRRTTFLDDHDVAGVSLQEIAKNFLTVGREGKS